MNNMKTQKTDGNKPEAVRDKNINVNSVNQKTTRKIDK